MNLTKEQETEITRLKSYFPFRIIWIEINKAGEFDCFASTDRRQLNKSAKLGNAVYVVK